MKTRLIAAILVVLVVGLAWKTLAWLDRPTRRSQLVAGFVREQRELLRARTPEDTATRSSALSSVVWADELPELRSWIVSESLRGRAPEELSIDLKQLVKGHVYSFEMDFAIARWERVLTEWANSKRISDLSPARWLDEGSQKLFEGDGYSRIDRAFDGTIDYLWAIEDLTLFIDANPTDPRLPEALFLLGTAYANLRGALPQGMRDDRVLNLVYEYFPESLWADQATAFWKRRRANAG